jgi:NAD(P)-dependent dehydrogenase (short-subunit alcohol dehydrogenase family)
MDKSLVGSPTVLVTGAGRGIGRGIAIACADIGCSVVINYARDKQSATETVDICEEHRKSETQRFERVRANIASVKGRNYLFNETIKRFGRIDALINNAGVAPKVRNDITMVTVKSFSDVIRVNLEAPFFLTQQVVNYWLSEKIKPLLPSGYTVMFVSSISANTVSTDRGEYCISKAGLSIMSQLWAARLAKHNIQVFELRPGIIETDMTRKVKDKYDLLISQGVVPQMRWGTPGDVGLVVSSILSGHFRYSTGQVFNIDGGFHIQRL